MILFRYIIYDIYNFFLLTERPIFTAAQLSNRHSFVKHLKPKLARTCHTAAGSVWLQACTAETSSSCFGTSPIFIRAIRSDLETVPVADAALSLSECVCSDQLPE